MWLLAIAGSIDSKANTAKNNIVNTSFYVAGMVAVKVSILLLYHRIFPSHRFRKALMVLGSFIGRLTIVDLS